MGLLDYIFPKRCIGCKAYGSYICSLCFASLSFTDEMICAVCNKSAIDGITHPGCRTKFSLDGMLASTKYVGLMKKLIYQFKYQPYLTDLRHPLGELFVEGQIQKECFATLTKKKPVLIPIPLHLSKLKQRGYNQAKLLAQGLGKSLGIPVWDVLLRVKKTRSQYQLKREERQENMQGAFMLKQEVNPQDVQDKIVLLVDDVTTSGTTFSEAAGVLKKAGAKEVWGIALAHGS